MQILKPCGMKEVLEIASLSFNLNMPRYGRFYGQVRLILRPGTDLFPLRYGTLTPWYGHIGSAAPSLCRPICSFVFNASTGTALDLYRILLEYRLLLALVLAEVNFGLRRSTVAPLSASDFIDILRREILPCSVRPFRSARQTAVLTALLVPRVRDADRDLSRDVENPSNFGQVGLRFKGHCGIAADFGEAGGVGA